MISAVDLRLAELLTARLCHELAGAITAVGSGVDLLADPDLEVDPEALALVGDSARHASSRLQFYRFAYGFGGDGEVAGPPPRELAIACFETSRISCRYGGDVARLPLIQQKLACNLLAFGAETLTRGGQIAIDARAGGFRLEASGEGISVARERSAALALRLSLRELTPRTVQGYFTGLLARDQGWRLVDVGAPGRLYITASEWKG